MSQSVTRLFVGQPRLHRVCQICLSHVKENKDQTKKSDTKEYLNCLKCEYKTEKEAILKKPKITKHENHQCIKCKENLPSFMALLKHAAL